MPDRPPFPHRRPLGKALRRTAADRERLATITPADIAEARRLAYGTPVAGFVEATLEPEKERA